MRISFLLSSIVLITFFSGNPPPKQKTILVVVAHPDDENMGGAVLAKFGRMNYRVQVIVATDGKFSPMVSGIPEGDSLAKVRQAESKCACEKLGIDPPIYLSLERLDTKIGVRPYLNERKKFLSELKRHIETIRPDILIAYGVDGEYGHSEHIVVTAGVMELLLREGWVKKYPLFFWGSTKEQVEGEDDLSYVDGRYLEYEITYSAEDEKKSIEASKCYISQFTAKELKEEEETRLKDQLNMIPFMKFEVREKEKVKDDLFLK